MHQLRSFRLLTGTSLTLLAILSFPALAQNPTPIYQIQGKTDTSPLAGQDVVVEGIVTGDFQAKGQLSGFYIQDPVGDGDSSTSDGIFVYLNARSPAVNVEVKSGDKVRVTGRAEEFHGQTQIGRVAAIAVLPPDAAAKPLVPVSIQLPLPDGSSFEPYEGMWVTFPQALTVTAQNDLKRYGSLTVSQGRLFVPSNVQPIAPTTIEVAKKADALRSFVLDDDSGAQNPKPIPYLDANNTLRTGSMATGLTGILGYDFDTYRLQPTVAPVFTGGTRPLIPPTVGGSLKIAAANVQNYWTTFNDADHPRARGTKTAAEFARQSAKVVAELKGLDADVVGLMELENNGDVSITDLVTKLNAAYGVPTYAFVPAPAAGGGPDLIHVGLIYKPDKVSMRGPSLAFADPIFDRYPLAQTFVSNADGAAFTVVVNHFKSKGGGPQTGDIDLGEGAWNLKRTKQATQLLQFVQDLQKSSGDPDVLAIGDFNAYVEEAPLRTLRDGGLKHINLRLAPEERYSFGYDGHFGSLDHAFATPSMDGQITGITEWHINSDEPFFLGYEGLSDVGFQATPYRASDHDPLLIGLNLK